MTGFHKESHREDYPPRNQGAQNKMPQTLPSDSDITWILSFQKCTLDMVQRIEMPMNWSTQDIKSKTM